MAKNTWTRTLVDIKVWFRHESLFFIKGKAEFVVIALETSKTEVVSKSKDFKTLPTKVKNYSMADWLIFF